MEIARPEKRLATILDSCKRAASNEDVVEVAQLTSSAEIFFQNDVYPEDAPDCYGVLGEIYQCKAETSCKAANKSSLPATLRQTLRQQGVNTICQVYMLNPSSAEAATQVAQFMRRHKIFEGAIVFFRRALELDPKSVKAKMALKSAQTDLKLSRTTAEPDESKLVLPALPPLPEGFCELGASPSFSVDSDGFLTSSMTSVAASRMESRGSTSSSAPMPSGAMHVQPLTLVPRVQNNDSFGAPALSSGSLTSPPLRCSPVAASPPAPHALGNLEAVSPPPVVPVIAAVGGSSLRKRAPSGASSPPQTCNPSNTDPTMKLSFSPPVVNNTERVVPQWKATAPIVDLQPSSAQERLNVQKSATPTPATLGTGPTPGMERGLRKASASPSLNDPKETDAINAIAQAQDLLPRYKTRLTVIVLIVLVVLHNVLEGSGRPVFRVVGVPLSVFTTLVAFAVLRNVL